MYESNLFKKHDFLYYKKQSTLFNPLYYTYPAEISVEKNYPKAF